MGGMTSRGRDRFRGNFNKQFNHNPHRPERRNEDDYASPRRFPENRASYRPAPRATSSSHRGRSNWEKNSSQQIHARAKQVAPSPQKDSSSTSPNKFKSDETTTKELWADVTMGPLLSNHDEMDDDEYASASEVHFSSTRDDDCGNIDEEESTTADASEKKTFKEEPPSADEDELNPDQDSSRKDESALSKTKRKKPTPSQDLPQYFIRLQCPHCHQRSVTFREYIGHLSSQRHAESLRKISLQHRMSLAKLRTRQRKEQLQIEAQSSRPAHSSRMNFCAICKLYHSESRPNHETTELHKIIKNFLMPSCPICRVNFKSRMLYEKHVATLTHIKNKINMEKTYERRRKEERKTDPTGDQEDFVLLDLDNFMTLDAVGSVDGDGDGCPSLEEVVIGEEFVKKVEVYYCEICQRYLSRTDPADKVLELHCRTRAHHHAVEEKQRDNIPDDSHADANEGCSETPETPADSGELNVRPARSVCGTKPARISAESVMLLTTTTQLQQTWKILSRRITMKRMSLKLWKPQMKMLIYSVVLLVKVQLMQISRNPYLPERFIFVVSVDRGSSTF